MTLNDSSLEATDDYSSYWASIPDPPTPDNAETLLPQRKRTADDNPAGRRRKRRGSTAPLKDVTNASVDRDGDLKGEKPSGTVLGLELESDSEDELNNRPKRSRKRRSLLLPSDDGVHESAKSINESRDEDAQIEYINDKHIQSFDPEEIVHLVRKYCSLPLDQRLNSQESKQIELLSSYPMPGKILNIFDKNNENLKRDFMLRAQPMVNLMEEQKQRDITDARSFTGCEVRKVRGGFEYFDLESGDTIDAEEYRVRYCAMIEEHRAKRVGVGGNNVEQSKIESGEPSPCSVDDSNMDMDESTFTSPDDSLCPETSAVSNTKASSECLTIASSAREHGSSTPLQNPTTASSHNPSHETTSNDVPPHPLLGSMPPSDDPRVLEARRKLFHSIDAALATYSHIIPPRLSFPLFALVVSGDGNDRAMQNTIAARYNIRKLPSCGPTHSKSLLTAGGETSRRLTRRELQDACRRHKTQEIAAMASSRKLEARSIQNQRATNRGGDTVDAASQMQSLDAGVKLCARKYNEAKSQADKVDDELNSRCDELAELERESKALHEMLEGNNSEAKKITQLSAEIEETNNFSEQILMYRHQLHHMHDRISKNSVTMDGHIGEMSATLASLQKERDRAQKMLAEVESGLTFASLELDDTIRDTNIAEEERNSELAIKQIEANDASRMERWNRQRIDSNLSLHQQLSGGDKSEIERIHRSIRDRKSQLKELNLSMDKTTARLGEVETSFLHLKQATGVNSLPEMVDKFSCHEDNHKQLLKEKKDAEDRLIAARATVSSDEEAFDQIKANGLGDTELNRDIINDIKSDISDERSEGKIVQSTNARLEALLLGLRQGGIILYNRLRPYHSMLLDEEAPALGEIDSTNAAQAASDTLDMINFTEKILGKILLDIGGIQRVDTKSDVEKDGNADSPGSNIRIQPKSNADEDDIITVKTAKDDSDPSDEVLSRARLKKNSQHYSSEMKRAQPLKNKKSTTKPLTQPRSKDSEAPMTQTKIKDNVDRLSSHPSSRPKPISSRDDPLDRVNAFLTELPFLE